MLRSRLRLLVACGLLAAPATAAAAPPATAATFAAVLAEARPGDTITLSGDFPAGLSLRALTFAPPITLDAHAATLASLKLDTVTGVKVIGGAYQANAAIPGWVGPIYVIRSASVSLDGVTVRGGTVTFRDSSSVALRGSRLIDAGNLAALIGVDTAEVSGNAFMGQQVDGVDCYSCRHVRIVGNVFAGAVPAPGAHADAIQIDNFAGSFPSSDIEVAWNLITGPVMGVSAFHSAGYSALNVHDNVLETSASNGVSLFDCTGCSIMRNTFQRAPGALYGPTIRTDGSVGVAQCANAGSPSAAACPALATPPKP